MIFRANPTQRFFRYVAIFLFSGVPLILSVFAFSDAIYPEDRGLFIAFCVFLALCGLILINYAFWEKLFSVLILTKEEIQWKCPLRKTKIIPVAKCIEIGAYLENANNGIPSEQIYFSTYQNPLQNMNKYGVIKSSECLIKFSYSEQLYNYIMAEFSCAQASCLVAYHQKRDRKNF